MSMRFEGSDVSSDRQPVWMSKGPDDFHDFKFVQPSSICFRFHFDILLGIVSWTATFGLRDTAL